jgi:NDP-sugar pyrophosphorylase family protein
MIEHGYFKALGNNQPILAYSFNGLWLTFDDPQAIVQAQAKHSNRLAKMLA